MSESLSQVAEDLVERARLGDELAAAQIAEVGRMARVGEGDRKKVQASYVAIEAYIARSPARNDPGNPFGQRGTQIGSDARGILKRIARVSFGAESTGLITSLPLVGGRRAFAAAIMMIASKPLPANAIDVAVQEYTTEEAQNAFYTAACNPLEYPLEAFGEEERPYAAAGHILGYALRLQAIRKGAPIHVFSPDMGWELGY